MVYLRSTGVRKHVGEWKELARLSNLQYHPSDLARELKLIEGIDVPRLGLIGHAISGRLGDTWFAVLQSTVRKPSLGSVLGKTMPASFCILVEPTIQLPEFCLRKKAGRGITAALNALLESEIEMDPSFSKQYSLQGRSPEDVKRLFDGAIAQWFVSSSPMDVQFHYQGDVAPTNFPLELHAKNKTVTLSFLGGLRARDVQPFMNRAKQICDQLR